MRHAVVIFAGLALAAGLAGCGAANSAANAARNAAKTAQSAAAVGSAAASSAVAGATSSSPQGSPPPNPVEVIPIQPPGSNVVWAGGHWRWDARHQIWIWKNGRWMRQG
ncbi:MAG TPA: hypothetical protein VFC78_03790 [Tepidisphaeraceae bacterium]|nr:hypothetical protein [Tepidisphaeraceae bacterium]